MTDIVARVCAQCGAYQSYPRPVCHACHGKSFQALETPAAGVIYSMTTVWRAPNPAMAEEVPYVVALVRGPQNGLLMLRLTGFDGTPPRTGDPVRIAPGPTGLAAYPASP